MPSNLKVSASYSSWAPQRENFLLKNANKSENASQPEVVCALEGKACLQKTNNNCVKNENLQTPISVLRACAWHATEPTASVNNIVFG